MTSPNSYVSYISFSHPPPHPLIILPFPQPATEETARASDVVAKEETGIMNEESPEELAPQQMSERMCVWGCMGLGLGANTSARVSVHQIRQDHIPTL